MSEQAFPVGTEQTGFCTALREHANTEAGLVRVQIGPQDLQRLCNAFGALLDDDAAYYGPEARFGFDSHADAIRTVFRARRALEELRAIATGAA